MAAGKPRSPNPEAKTARSVTAAMAAEPSPVPSELYDEQYYRGHEERYRHGIFESRIREIEPFLKDVTGKIVLDSGCGYGFFSRMACENGARVVALDSSRVALSFLSDRGASVLSRVRGDALIMGIRDGAVDMVLSADMIEHVPDATTYLREIHRVLKPRGRCLLMTNNDRGFFKVRGLRRLYYEPTKHLRLRQKLDAIKATERARRFDANAHVNLLSVRRLARAGREAGFRVLHWHTFPFLRHPLRDRVLDAFFLRFFLRAYLHDYILMVLEKPTVERELSSSEAPREAPPPR
jgi:SAM-dependent methyltransferase